MIKHQIILLVFLSATLFSCKKSSEKLLTKQESEVKLIENKIHLTVANIPKIESKVITGLNSYKTDKSPTLTYKLFADNAPYTITYDSLKKNVIKEFYEDTIYLKLRYNPGKYQLYILKKGDSAFIDYLDGKPNLKVKNRTFKKHDLDIVDVITKFNLDDDPFKFFFKKLSKEEKEKKEQRVFKTYDKILTAIDSLSKNNLLSNAEYNYYKKHYTYKRASKKGEFNLDLLKNSDLHIEGYNTYLRQYVFSNLKKKIISLGNGMARNSLESFDFVFDSNNFSKNNKKHLLIGYLKNIKIDFPNSIFKGRYAKYQSLYSVGKNKILVTDKSNFSKSKSEVIKDVQIADSENNVATVKENNKVLFKDNSKFLKSIYETTNNVQLVDSLNNFLTLKEIINKNKGKVIYVDFWASWCAPCLWAFPSYVDLKKEYNKDHIVFIFISVDEDERKWKEAALKDKLTNSYLAKNYPEAKFYKDLQLKGFPRYLIFDRNGQLKVEKAPVPDSDNVRGFINELLLE